MTQKPNPTTLFEKVWHSRLVKAETHDTPAVLYIDIHLVHEVTSPQAFDELRRRKLNVHQPKQTIATMDHSTPTASIGADGSLPVIDASAAKQIAQLETNCRDFGIGLFNMSDVRRGIVHVIGPELGATQPGRTIVCGDSHTCTHGAFGALAFGIGTTEVGHVLATQCVLQRKPKAMAINVDGELGQGVTAKDLILAIIGQIGVDGGTGHVIEYRGTAIEAMSMDERMTLCNMSIEAGARTGMIAPDETTFAYLKDRSHAPKGQAWDDAVARWRTLKTDEGARFDRSISLDASGIEPMVTFGTNPGMVIPVSGSTPDGNTGMAKSLHYMGFEPNQPIAGTPIDVVFVGSCTNSRLSDLRAAASVLQDNRVAPSVRMLVVPGSQAIKQQAEKEGLARIFTDAGAEWRESGCSMCIAMNGDTVDDGKYALSTSNRNFEGRQGAGSRTLLASPLTAAASAITGVVTDPRNVFANAGGA